MMCSICTILFFLAFFSLSHQQDPIFSDPQLQNQETQLLHHGRTYGIVEDQNQETPLLYLPNQRDQSQKKLYIFESWCRRHGRTYGTVEEKEQRFRVFSDNLVFIREHNQRANSNYTVGLNAFADLTHHEFKIKRLGLCPSILRFSSSNFRSDQKKIDVPSSLDWRDKGAVTNVKDQGSCGACWAFSATGAIEGINKIVTGSLISLSEQEIIDCDTTYNSGCGGGLMDYAFKWVTKNHGIDTEKDYPYREVQGSCIKDKAERHVVTIDGHTDIPSNSEDLILQAVAKQPVSVGICGSERSFQLYSSGIFSGPCSTSLDHAVLIVGYGSKNGVDYWIVKNSWGTSWGMDGYMHMLRNSGDSQGVCGINMMPSYPTKSGANPPPSPPPGPVKCSLLTYCPSGNTCCCTWRFLGICLSWSCCDLDNAVCCKDGQYCCPQDYPVCNTATGYCLKGSGNWTEMDGLKRRQSFGGFRPWEAI
ncbi:hypothetical protein AMTRI_Chr03g146940 [Amborella trichopoda]